MVGFLDVLVNKKVKYPPSKDFISTVYIYITYILGTFSINFADNFGVILAQ